MRPPEFWLHKDGREAAPVLRTLLMPLSWVWKTVTARRIAGTTPIDVGIPVICVGNVTLGGTGKTPITQWLIQVLRGAGIEAHGLSRGYKGSEKGPMPVHRDKHTAAQVGDEPLMMAQSVPVWVAAGRDDGARAMAAHGVQTIVMDDGFQNPLVHKTLSLLVVDGETGFGNERVCPAGPLREPIPAALSRTDAVILMLPYKDYEPEADLIAWFDGRPVIKAWLAPAGGLPDGKLFAFAGIGRPNKFFDALRREGADLADCLGYDDHHAYSEGDIRYLHELAKEVGAKLVTTEKDYARLPATLRAGITPWPVDVYFDDPDAVLRLIKPIIAAVKGAA